MIGGSISEVSYLAVEIQLCALAVDVLLIYFFVRNKNVGLYSGKIFFYTLLTHTFGMFFDVLSVFGITNSSSMPEYVTEILCRLYLISIILYMLFAFIYTYTDIAKLRQSKALKTVWVLFFSLSVALTTVLEIGFEYKNRHAYSYGSAVNATYIASFVCLLATIILTFTHSSLMNIRKKRVVRLWVSLEIIAAVVQFFYPQLLVVGFAATMGLLIIYAEFENVEVHLNQETGCFSSASGVAFLKELYERNVPFSAILIHNNEEWKIAQKEEGSVLLEMTEYLSRFTDAKLFHSFEYDFVLYYDSSDPKENLSRSGRDIQDIMQRFSQQWNNGKLKIETKYIYFPDASVVGEHTSFTRIYHYYRERVESITGLLTVEKENVDYIKSLYETVNEIKSALAEDRIEVAYQPIYAVKEEKFLSAEALARIRTKDGKILQPGAFIPISEEFGLVDAIGLRVFEKLCRFIKKEDIQSLGLQYVEINLSISQCEDEELAEKFAQIFKRENISPERVNFEITERSQLTKKTTLLENMKSLMDIGSEFSLDDFGTGESNLSYVTSMPVKIVKFDKSLVNDYFKSSRAKLVMTYTVKMLKELGMDIVAEGVEEKEKIDELSKIGIDHIQGYCFSKPLFEKEFVKFIKENNH